MHYGIGVGSKTSTGGEVIEGNSSVIFDGFIASSLGQMATCKVCQQGMGPIVGVGPRDLLLPAGLAARAGDYVACGCPLGANVLLPAGTIQIGAYGGGSGAPAMARRGAALTPQAESAPAGYSAASYPVQQAVSTSQPLANAMKVDGRPSRYTVTIYTAAPGTPLRNSPNDPSAAGHMWFGITELDGALSGKEKSFGFGPNETGIRGPGHVGMEDTKNYIDPYYARTMEITKAQYKKLLDFGTTAVNKSEKYFDLYYNGATNSCIDFTNAALRFAGLNPVVKLTLTPNRSYPIYEKKGFEGALKVLDNIPEVKKIPAPLPASKLNKEHYNKMPKRTSVQRLLSHQGSEHASGETTT